jgi:hypothetical protein
MSAVATAAPSGIEVRWGAADTLTAAAALGAVVDALPELQEIVGDPAGVDRLELFRRVRSMLASGSTLLVLEDLHWADEATLDLLRSLGRRLSGLRALLVVTYRPEDVPPQPAAFYARQERGLVTNLAHLGRRATQWVTPQIFMGHHGRRWGVNSRTTAGAAGLPAGARTTSDRDRHDGRH